jgi:hypothetical protein
MGFGYRSNLLERHLHSHQMGSGCPLR